ncbi:hypothetical protein JZ751_026540, partial [Albula glossodonta]
ATEMEEYGEEEERPEVPLLVGHLSELQGLAAGQCHPATVGGTGSVPAHFEAFSCSSSSSC